MAVRGFVRYARPLWVGSLVVSAVAAALGYFIGSALWTATQRAREARNAHRRARLANKAKLSPTPAGSQKMNAIPNENPID